LTAREASDKLKASDVQVKLANGSARMTLDQLNAHPFVEQALWESMDLLKATGFNPLKSETWNPDLDEQQFYVVRVASALANAMEWLQQLHQAVHFLTDYSYRRPLAEAGVTRWHHVAYNVENYEIRVQSIYDRFLQLSNAVFHLCISDELVSHSVIVSNLFVSRTKVPRLLKAVKKVLEPKAQARHDLIHKRTHRDAELERLHFLYMPSRAIWGTGRGRTFEQLKHHRAQRLKDITARLREDFQTMNLALVQTAEPLFSELFHQYKQQKSRLARIG
jgi:Cthe_2314-like HEPN